MRENTHRSNTAEPAQDSAQVATAAEDPMKFDQEYAAKSRTRKSKADKEQRQAHQQLKRHSSEHRDKDTVPLKK